MISKIWTHREDSEVTQLLQDLVRLKTINKDNNEMVAVRYIAAILDKEGIEYQIMEPAPGRGNIIAKIEGGDEEPLILLSHLDVVDVSEEKWDHDPFAAVIEDKHIIGRGTLDTKQLTAMGLMVMLLVKRNKLPLNRDLIFVATADEENGSNYGMKYLVDKHRTLIPNGYVINEGGGFVLPNLEENFRICACGEKGVCEVTFKLEYDKEFMANLNEILSRVSSYDSGEILCSISRKFAQIAKPYVEKDITIKNLWQYITRNTLSVSSFDFDFGEMSKGETYEVKVTYRFIQDFTKKEVLKFLGEIFQGLQCKFEVTKYFGGYESDTENDLIRTLENQSDKYDNYSKLLPIIALGNTDGRFIRNNVYGYSPLLEEDSFDLVLKKVHGHNESISIDSLIYGTKVILGTVIELSSTKQ